MRSLRVIEEEESGKGKESRPVAAADRLLDSCRCALHVAFHHNTHKIGRQILPAILLQETGSPACAAKMPSTTLPAPLAAFHASAPYRTAVQDILSRREAQRRTVAFSDPEKLAEVPLNVLPQKTRDAFRADHADHELNALRNRYANSHGFSISRADDLPPPSSLDTPT